MPSSSSRSRLDTSSVDQFFSLLDGEANGSANGASERNGADSFSCNHSGPTSPRNRLDSAELDALFHQFLDPTDETSAKTGSVPPASHPPPTAHAFLAPQTSCASSTLPPTDHAHQDPRSHPYGLNGVGTHPPSDNLNQLSAGLNVEAASDADTDALWCHSPYAVRRVVVRGAQYRRDANGRSFVAFSLHSTVATGHLAQPLHLETERRYTDFVTMHDELYISLALPADFPIRPNCIPLAAPRARALQAYLDALLKLCDETPPPTLLAFLRPPLYAAVATAVVDCLASIEFATPLQALAILRGHPTNESVQIAAIERIRDLVVPSAEMQAIFVANGATEAVTATMRRLVTPSPALAAAAVSTLLHLSLGNKSSHLTARSLLLRLGITEILCREIEQQIREIDVISPSVQLLALLTASQSVYLGQSSHYEFVALGFVTRAMRLHQAHAGFQRHCCAAIHALARRSDALAAAAADAGAVTTVVRALRRFRGSSEAVAQLQASGCGAVAAMVVSAVGRAALEAEQGLTLVLSAICEYESDSAAESAVQLCGWRVVLEILHLESAGALASPDGDSAEVFARLLSGLVWRELLPVLRRSLKTHANRVPLQAICLEIVASLLCLDAVDLSKRKQSSMRIVPSIESAREVLQMLCALLSPHTLASSSSLSPPSSSSSLAASTLPLSASASSIKQRTAPTQPSQPPPPPPPSSSSFFSFFTSRAAAKQNVVQKSVRAAPLSAETTPGSPHYHHHHHHQQQQPQQTPVPLSVALPAAVAADALAAAIATHLLAMPRRQSAISLASLSQLTKLDAALRSVILAHGAREMEVRHACTRALRRIAVLQRMSGR